MNIMQLLDSGPLNVNDIAEKLGLPFSTTAVNIKKLEDAGLITTEVVPGRGSQKINSSKFERIVIDLGPEKLKNDDSTIIEMPIGDYIDCKAEPTCGLLSAEKILGLLDDP
jgi:predicted transcriptional regulator